MHLMSFSVHISNSALFLPNTHLNITVAQPFCFTMCKKYVFCCFFMFLEWKYWKPNMNMQREPFVHELVPQFSFRLYNLLMFKLKIAPLISSTSEKMNYLLSLLSRFRNLWVLHSQSNAFSSLRAYQTAKHCTAFYKTMRQDFTMVWSQCSWGKQ